MAKKRKKQNKSKNKYLEPTKLLTNNRNQEERALYRKQSRVLIFINPIVSLTSTIIIFVDLYFPGSQQDASLLALFRILSFPICLILFITKMTLTRKLVTFIKNKDYQTQLPLARNSFWTNVLFLAIALFPPIYKSPIIREIPSYLIYYLPQLGQSILSWTSNFLAFLASTGLSILGNILLGVLGNFIYDLLKNRFSKEKIRK